MDQNSGMAVIYDESVPEKIRLDAVMSSATIPSVFPLVGIGEYALSDSGAMGIANTPVIEAITKCRDFGFDDENIIVDIIMCQNSVTNLTQFSKSDSKYMNAWELYQRKSNLKSHSEHYNDIYRSVRQFPRVTMRHLVEPTKDLDATFFFDDKAKI